MFKLTQRPNDPSPEPRAAVRPVTGSDFQTPWQKIVDLLQAAKVKILSQSISLLNSFDGVCLHGVSALQVFASRVLNCLLDVGPPKILLMVTSKPS